MRKIAESKSREVDQTGKSRAGLPGFRLFTRFDAMPLSPLHDQGEVFEFLLKNGQSAACHLYPAGGIHGRLGRDAVSAAHEEYLQELSGFTRVDKPTLQQVVTQRRQLGC